MDLSDIFISLKQKTGLHSRRRKIHPWISSVAYWLYPVAIYVYRDALTAESLRRISSSLTSVHENNSDQLDSHSKFISSYCFAIKMESNIILDPTQHPAQSCCELVLYRHHHVSKNLHMVDAESYTKCISKCESTLLGRIEVVMSLEDWTQLLETYPDNTAQFTGNNLAETAQCKAHVVRTPKNIQAA